jgi:hypothetical protein
MAQGGLYHSLYTIQQGGGGARDPAPAGR